MTPRDLGKALLAISGFVVAVVIVRLAYLARSYGVGFDVLGMWNLWRGWILLWLLVTAAGFVLLAAKRL